MKHKKLIYIISVTLITMVLLYLVDQIFHVKYLGKVLIKMILFFVFPVFYIVVSKDNFVKDSLFRSKSPFRIKMSHILGVLVFIVIVIAFQLIRHYMNTEVLISEFEDKHKINQTNIVYYGLFSKFNSLFLISH